MRVEADTAAIESISAGLRRAATRVSTLDLPHSPHCEDVAAADAIAALLAVCGESLGVLSQALQSVGTLVEVAAVDYARAEMHVENLAGDR